MLTVVLLMSVAFWQICSGTGVEEKRAERKQNLEDVIFTCQLLFAFNARSLLHCACACRSTYGCLSFTYTRDTSLYTSCRGHTSVMSSGSASQPSLGTSVYIFDGSDIKTVNANWLYDPCTSDSDCSAENSECFAGKCLCTPGFYFSLSRHTCLAACDTCSLQTEFVRYPKARIVAGNIGVVFDLSLDACKAACVEEPQCRTVDYQKALGICNLQTVTTLDIPADWQVGGHGYDYYQRACA